MTEQRGFIVAAWDEFRPGGRASAGLAGDRMLLTGRLEDGRSFAVLRASPGPALFVAREKAGEAGKALGDLLKGDFPRGSGPGASCVEEWTDLGGSALARICLPRGSLRRAERALSAAGIALAGVDRRRADEELSALGIRGPVLIRGEERPGKRVDTVFVEPSLEGAGSAAAARNPAGNRVFGLRWLALDIETDREERVVAVSLAEPLRPGIGAAPGPGPAAGEVLFVQGRGRVPSSPGIEVFPDEVSMLAALAGRIVRRDPDVITGWNILDFDFRVILARCSALGLSFEAGRTDAPATFVERSGRKAVLDLPGRAVIDALRLVRAGSGGAGSRYEDLSLETVAQELLGEGKSVSSKGEDKIEELELLRARDPDSFCAYCLRDSELVLRILAKTGLDELTARRASLTGVSLDLAWTSIPAFERVYGSELRARHIAIPPKHDRPVSGAAGGTVLEASAGIFPRVLVFDFRSLYPSIMRTFNVDPLAYARADARAPAPGDIVAPNGARFDPVPGVMPGLIAEYAAERERALAEGDEVAAYVYKILQNSFYGVLGAEGCRYARTEIAGAITSFGKKFLVTARDFFEARGRRVLYGDTDSVFVLSGLGEGSGYEELMEMGEAAATELNAGISQLIRREYGLESMLRIRCEKAYERFLIPRLKSSATRLKSQAGEGVRGPATGRGRAKGYAGLLLGSDGSSVVEVKGMEAVRSDFTPLARDFQVELLGLVFSGAGEERLRDYCHAEESALRRGERDDKLVYRKTLRRLADDYASETPQVRAARLMGWKAKRGRVSYVMTGGGAEPVGARSGAGLDYDHYVQRQLLPIAASIADAVGMDARSWLAEGSQFELDFGN